MAKSKKIHQETKSTDGQRIGIFGASGSGKTTRARSLIQYCKRLIVFDPKQEWLREGQKWLNKPIIVSNVFEFKRILKKVFYKPEFYIIYVPPLDDASTHLSCICNEVFKIQEGYLQSHFAKITLLVDEAQEGIPSGTSKLNPSHGALIIAKMGRSRGINLVVVSQRIKAVDIGVRANLSGIFIFRLSELADINEANQIVMNKEKLRTMKNYSFFFKDLRGEISFFEKK